jgi:hypothetical protein
MLALDLVSTGYKHGCFSAFFDYRGSFHHLPDYSEYYRC